MEGFFWNALARFLTRAHSWTGVQTFTSPVFNTGVSGTAVSTDGTLAGNLDTLVVSQKAIRTYVAAQIAAIPDPLLYKGVIDCSGSPNYPAADAGHVYVVSASGLIGGGAGVAVAAGDLLLCKVDGSASGTQAAVGANWDILEKNIDLTNIVISGGTIDGVSIGATTPATTLAGKPPEALTPATADATVAQMSGGLINNYGQVDDAVITLPTCARGMCFTCILGTTVAKYFRLKARTNDKIYLDGAAGADNGYVGVASAAQGNAISFQAFQTGAATYDWYAATLSGTWVAG